MKGRGAADMGYLCVSVFLDDANEDKQWRGQYESRAKKLKIKAKKI